MISLSGATKRILESSTEWQRQRSVIEPTAGNNLKARIDAVNDHPLYTVPAARLRTKYQFLDGKTTGQEKGGVKADPTGLPINWLITLRRAPIAINKTDKIRVFDPDTNQTADAWKFDYRKYHELWVLKSMEKASFAEAGDVWTVGRHHLMCGDATSQEDMDLLMDGRKANLFLTEPPYAVSYTSSKGLTIKNDNLKEEAFRKFLVDAFQNGSSHLEKGASAYVFHADTDGLVFREAFIEAGFHLSGVCIWAKDSLVFGRSPYQWSHEPILYGWKKDGKHKWYAGRAEKTVWNFAKPKRNENHPSSKPVDLLCYPIQNSSQANGIVLDPFGGSGSTMNHYRGLWEIEESFRLTKSDLKARPVYVSREDHINAHFLSCFMALLLTRLVQLRTHHDFPAGQLLDAMRQMSGTKMPDNRYIFDDDSPVVEALKQAFQIDFDRQFLNQKEIKQMKKLP